VSRGEAELRFSVDQQRSRPFRVVRLIPWWEDRAYERVRRSRLAADPTVRLRSTGSTLIRRRRELSIKVAYVLYPDFTRLDLIGRYEVISRWPDAEMHFPLGHPSRFEATVG
jgi:hypothetical protein